MSAAEATKPTGHGDRHPVTIIVDGTPDQWAKERISYAEAVTLYDPSYPQHPERSYTVTYKRGPHENPEGTLSAGGSAKVKDRMEFSVKLTSQS
jgi:Multiubiquitin